MTLDDMNQLQFAQEDPVGFIRNLTARHVVIDELQRLASWLDEPLYFYHYRDKDKIEVDIVIETGDGAVIGIKVNASATLEKSDFQGLMRLKKAAGKHFHFGVLLYDGDHVNAFDKGIYSIPIGSIWE